MIKSDQHMIAQQAFEIIMQEQEKAHEIQSGISLLQETAVLPLLQEVMDSFSDNECIYRFEKIELDLGTVSIYNYQKEIVLKIEEQLTQFFKESISSNGYLREGKKIIIQDQKLESLKHFLLYGYFDWSSNSQQSAKQLLLELVEQHPAGLVVLLRNLGKKKTIRNRLVFQFNDETLDQLVSAIAVKESEYILSYKDQMLDQQKNQEFIETSFNQYRDLIWQIILAYIFIASNGYYNKKNFLNYLIKNTARAYNLSYTVLLSTIFNGIAASKSVSGANEFQRIIAELQEASSNELPQKNDKTASKSREEEVLKALHFYINNGFTTSVFLNYTKRELQQNIKELLLSNNKELIKLLENILKSEKKTGRLAAFADLQMLDIIQKKIPKESFGTASVFFEKLSAQRSELSNNNKLVLDRILAAKSFFIIYAYEGRKSVPEIIKSLLLRISIEVKPYNKEYIRLLSHSLSKMPAALVKPISDFINSNAIPNIFEEKTLEKDFKEIVEEFLNFVNANEPETWYYWLQKRITHWAAAGSNYSEAGLLQFLIDYTSAKLKNPVLLNTLQALKKSSPTTNSGTGFLVALIENKMRAIAFNKMLFKDWSEEVLKILKELALQLNKEIKEIIELYIKQANRDKQEKEVYKHLLFLNEHLTLNNKKNRLPESSQQKEAILRLAFIFRYQKLPWWDRTYSWHQFNGDFRKYGKSMLSDFVFRNAISSKPSLLSVVTLLSEANLYLFWDWTDPSDNKKNGIFMKEVVSGFVQQLRKNNLLDHRTYHQLIKKLSLFVVEGKSEEIRKLLFRTLLEDFRHNELKMLLYLEHVEKTRKNSYQSAIKEFMTSLAVEIKAMMSNTTKYVYFRDSLVNNKAKLMHLIQSSTNTDLINEDKIDLKNFKILVAKSDFRDFMIDELGSKDILLLLKTNVSTHTEQQIRYFHDLITGIQSVISIKEYKHLKSVWLHKLLLQFSCDQWSSWKREDWMLFVKNLLTEAMGKKRLENLFLHDEKMLIKTVFSKKQIAQYTELLVPERVEEQLSEEHLPKELTPESYKKLDAKEPKEMTNPALIMNSGLILIAPYFGMLFERCGFMENGTFKSTVSRHEAARLLNYLVWGQELNEEQTMVLNKVLTGICITEPMNLKGTIPKTHKEIVESLLNAVRSQWKVMSGTSNEGLRTTFLQREGKLVEESEQFYLKVASGTFDMLLDQIPWSINQVKLSWMKKILITEWR
jgi:hypothetical protein